MSIKSDLTDSARGMRKLPTEAERVMWGLLRNHQLDRMKFRRQAPIGPYIADFVRFDAKLIVECDGGHHAHSNHDARRDAWLRSWAPRSCASGTPR